MNKTFISKAFLLFLIVFVIYACYLIFKPFLSEIIVATILASIFYTPYEWLARKLKNRRNFAALIMCIFIALLVVIPLTNFIVYTAQKSVSAYSEINKNLSASNIDSVIKNSVLEKFNFLGIDNVSLKQFLIEVAKKANDWLMGGAKILIKSTTSFIISLILIFFTMFFFFVDGKKMIEKIMYWTPLPNKYDKEIFKKFRDVSYSTIVSAFITAIAQGIIGAIGFLIIGLPAFFAGLAMAFLALLPYVGAAIVWFPVGIYLLIFGEIWQGVFLLLWGAIAVSMSDNIIRSYIIKSKAQVHPIFIIFSILGGISLFGFWGIVFGPLIISLAVTILHIYEMEYIEVLEK